MIGSFQGVVFQHRIETATFQVHAPAPTTTMGGGGHRLVLVDLKDNLKKEEAKKKLAAIPFKNIQRIKLSNGCILLVECRKANAESWNSQVAKDDVTGEAYPYVVFRIVYLIPRK